MHAEGRTHDSSHCVDMLQTLNKLSTRAQHLPEGMHTPVCEIVSAWNHGGGHRWSQFGKQGSPMVRAWNNAQPTEFRRVLWVRTSALKAPATTVTRHG